MKHGERFIYMRHKVLCGKMFLRNWFVVMNDKQQQRSVNHSTRRCERKKKEICTFVFLAHLPQRIHLRWCLGEGKKNITTCSHSRTQYLHHLLLRLCECVCTCEQQGEREREG